MKPDISHPVNAVNGTSSGSSSTNHTSGNGLWVEQNTSWKGTTADANGNSTVDKLHNMNTRFYKFIISFLILFIRPKLILFIVNKLI